MLLTPELIEYRDTVRARAAERIGPFVDVLDREQRFSPEVWAEVRDLELFGLPFPSAVGGLDGSFLAFTVATEAVARTSASAALYPGTTVQVAATLLRHGTPAQVERWVPTMVRGDAPVAWAFTEPQTGSDPKQLQTTAVPDGDGWRLNGQKLFISYARQAQVAVVFARTPGGSVGAFIVRTDTPGWATGTPFELLAMGGGEPAPIYLDDVHVPGDQLIGAADEGFQAMIAGEAQGKIRAAAICVGIAQRAIDEAATYALQRTHRGQSIATKFPTIQGLLGEMEASTLAARALVHHAAELIDRGGDVAREAAAARVVAGRAAREVTSAAMQVCGAYGLTRELPLERLYREGKFFEVAQGVAEIQRAIVARHVIADHAG
ncbi:MAG: acyl-CoA dehydrogenase family protein [Actinomycetota bacterium]|nr:acyl-CoA dehydrogenase family protein [Actinomycetota bacterium]